MNKIIWLSILVATLVLAVVVVNPFGHHENQPNDITTDATGHDETKSQSDFDNNSGAAIVNSTRELSGQNVVENEAGRSADEILTDVSDFVNQRLSSWVTDVYFAERRQSYHLRHRLAEISATELVQKLLGSTMPAESVTGIISPNAEFQLNMFDDTRFDIKITTANVMPGGAVAASGAVQSGAPAPSQVQLYVSAEGKISGSVSANNKTYLIKATPELPYYLILEMADVPVRDVVRVPRD